MADAIIIQPANRAWPELFEAEKAHLLAALGSQFIAIKHLSSTAVPGLDAKPIIDRLGGVHSIDEADTLLEPLCQLALDTSAQFNATLAVSARRTS